eukprot:scaffold138746_cov33-Attheya_sp.AAC.1
MMMKLNPTTAMRAATFVTQRGATMSRSTTTLHRFSALRMMSAAAPTSKPVNPEFSSGPCKKHPGYDVSSFDKRTLGRSHRSKIGKE